MKEEKQNKSKKIKYRKKKKPTVGEKPKQKVTYITYDSDYGTFTKHVNGVEAPFDPKTEIELQLMRAEDLEKNVVMFDKDLGIDLYSKNSTGTSSLKALANKVLERNKGRSKLGTAALGNSEPKQEIVSAAKNYTYGIENATNTVGSLSNDSRQAPPLPFWQRILTFIGIRRSK